MPELKLLFLQMAVIATRRGGTEIFGNCLFVPVLGLGAVALVQYVCGESVYPYLTKIELLRWSEYALLFFLAVQSFQSKENIKPFVWFLLSLGFDPDIPILKQAKAEYAKLQ